MGVIILEGPDNAGKSTLSAEMVKNIKGTEIVHPGKPPKSFAAIMMLIAAQISRCNSDKNYIFDRITPISEMVYRPIRMGVDSMNHPHRLTPIFMDAITRFIELDVLIVYCRPPMDALKSVEHVASIHDTEETLNVLRASSERVAHTYDSLMDLIQHLGGRVVVYDYTKQNSVLSVDELSYRSLGGS